MIEPFQHFFAGILDIHFGTDSPFNDWKVNNPDFQMAMELGIIQQDPTSSTSSVQNAKPMVMINMAKSSDRTVVSSTVKSGEDDDFGDCLIKLEPYEIQDPVEQSKCCRKI